MRMKWKGLQGVFQSKVQNMFVYMATEGRSLHALTVNGKTIPHKNLKQYPLGFGNGEVRRACLQ